MMGGGFLFSSRRRHTRLRRDWSSDVCSSDLVEHQHVAGRQQLRQVGETPIVETLLADPQQAGGIPRIRGTRGDQLARQFEIEQIDPHRV